MSASPVRRFSRNNAQIVCSIAKSERPCFSGQERAASLAPAASLLEQPHGGQRIDEVGNCAVIATHWPTCTLNTFVPGARYLRVRLVYADVTRSSLVYLLHKKRPLRPPDRRRGQKLRRQGEPSFIFRQLFGALVSVLSASQSPMERLSHLLLMNDADVDN
jgi:hypothetical protein